MAKATSTSKSGPSSKNVTKAKAMAAKSASSRASDKVSKPEKSPKQVTTKAKLTVKKAEKASTTSAPKVSAKVSTKVSGKKSDKNFPVAASTKTSNKATKLNSSKDETQQLLLTPKSEHEAIHEQSPQSTGSQHSQMPSAEDRQKMVQEAAYHLAEQDGFQPGQEHAYWVRAEAQVEKLLKEQSSDTTDLH